LPLFVFLRNIETGVVAEPDVNVDKAENIGTRTLEMMKGENVLSFNFKKSNQAVTLAAKTSYLNTSAVFSKRPLAAVFKR
jgi:hypothetical protein